MAGDTIIIWNLINRTVLANSGNFNLTSMTIFREAVKIGFKKLETVDENLRLVFLFITQERLILESKVNLEVKTISQEL